jgi:predicted nucleic acid-binding protein
MIVVDTNVIAYLYFKSEFSHCAEAVMTRDSVWAAPLLWRSEFRNVLAFYLRKKIITYPVALQIIEQAESLMDGGEYSASSESVLELIQSSQCSAYDCEFIYLARELKVPLVTADKKILAEFPKDCISLTEFS